MGGMLLLVGEVVNRNSLICFSGDVLCGIAFFCIFLSQLIHNFLVFQIRILYLLGKFSYPMYLFHMLINHLFIRYISYSTGFSSLDFLVRYFSVVSLSLALSLLLVIYFDKPLQRMVIKCL